ncbi:hypothetical protein FRC08_018872 [Ceratobasidium sp. 394]|nr:hypothetical protein FRC08_018872 [Ceratobasidium sp. 394]
MKVHNVFHASLLLPFKEDLDFHCPQANPPPIITPDGKEQYATDHIVSWRQKKDGLYYWIWWEGYDPLEDTKEHASKFKEMHDLLDDLHDRDPDAPMPIGYKPRLGDLKGKTNSKQQH